MLLLVHEQYLQSCNAESSIRYITHVVLHPNHAKKKSSQVTFIYIALFTIEIVSKQLHIDNMKVIQHRSILLLNQNVPN